VQAAVDCVRRREAGKGEELESSLPSGDMSSRVGNCGEVFCDRKVVRGWVSSIVSVVGRIMRIGKRCSDEN
jgi:hypothetical protein